MVKSDPLKQSVELQTNTSWWTWGEHLTVTVVNLDGGACRVVIESRRAVWHNVVADPSKAAAKLVSELTRFYGDRLALRPSKSSETQPDGKDQ